MRIPVLTKAKFYYIISQIATGNAIVNLSLFFN